MMPRVLIKKQDYMATDLSKWIVGKMYEKGLRQEDLAKLINISQPAFSARLKSGSFTYRQLLTLLKELNATDGEILKIMKG